MTRRGWQLLLKTQISLISWKNAWSQPKSSSGPSPAINVLRCKVALAFYSAFSNRFQCASGLVVFGCSRFCMSFAHHVKYLIVISPFRGCLWIVLTSPGAFLIVQGKT